MPVKSTPDGYHTATPYLIINGAAAAIEFYKKAFGATELFRMDAPGGKIGHAEIKIGDSPIMLADEFPEMDARGPQSFGGRARRKARSSRCSIAESPVIGAQMKKRIDIKSLVLGAFLGAIAMFSLAAAITKKPADNLRVRQLIIVDEKGAERIVIGAPVPDPQVMGKRLHRRSPATGIQINDANGNERGGIGTLEDGSFVIGMDDERNERVDLFFLPGNGAGLGVKDEKGRQRILLVTPLTGTSAGTPKLEIFDESGKAIFAVPPPK